MVQSNTALNSPSPADQAVGHVIIAQHSPHMCAVVGSTAYLIVIANDVIIDGCIHYALFLLLFYFLNLNLFYLQRERERFHLLAHSPNACDSLGWARLKSGIGDSTQTSQGSRDLNT